MPPAAKKERGMAGDSSDPGRGTSVPLHPCFTLAELATVARVLEALDLHRGLPSAG
jgi:hypothetical protein